MSSQMMTVEQASQRITSGARLLVAGDGALLRALPRGSWIGGSTPYFMSSEGGIETAQQVMVTELPDDIVAATVRVYSPDTLAQIPAHYPVNGVSFIILPFASKSHERFAAEGANWPTLFDGPLVGWVAGYSLSTSGRAVVVDGEGGDCLEDAAVVMHCQLREGVAAQVDIFNIFEPGDGDVLTFSTEGFSPPTVLVNGVTRSFAEYLSEVKADVRLPLVADFAGAMVNVSIQSIDAGRGTVALYAPVFTGVEYRLANRLSDYEVQFGAGIARRGNSSLFACNCILNFLHANLKGRMLPPPHGPITFGEVAWMLLNQTMVYVTLRPAGQNRALRLSQGC